MSDHSFLLTYSVSPVDDSDKKTKVADKVRKKIAELEEWEKLENVETTFVGDLFLCENDKREEAEEDVKKVFSEIVDKLDANTDVWVSVALLVNKLGKHIEFRF